MKRLLIGMILWIAAIANADLTPQNLDQITLSDLQQNFKTNLDSRHLILLDKTTKALRFLTPDGTKYVYAIGVVYAIDKGYGYSVGPFPGTLVLDNQFHWIVLQHGYSRFLSYPGL